MKNFFTIDIMILNIFLVIFKINIFKIHCLTEKLILKFLINSIHEKIHK